MSADATPPILSPKGPSPAAIEASKALIEEMRAGVVAGHHGYLKGQTDFVQKLADALPLVAERLVSYLLSPVTHVPDNNGKLWKVLDPNDDLTDGQLSLLRTLIPKLIPKIPDIAQDPAGAGKGPSDQPGGVHVHINTVGPQVVDGDTGALRTGEAQRVSTITVTPAYDAADTRPMELDPATNTYVPVMTDTERALQKIREMGRAEADEKMAAEMERARSGPSDPGEDLL